MNTDAETNSEFGQRVFQQFMELFVRPAVAERQAAGELAKPLDLRAAQIIFYPDGSKPAVRVNDEIKAIGQVKLRNGVSKKAGEPIYANEIGGLGNLKLAQQYCQDCGHATLMRFNDVWTIAFDFRYNKHLSNKHLDTAEEFFGLASVAYEKHHWSAFIDNLFSASELCAKAILLSMPDKKLREKATHKGIHTRFNRFASLGNVREEHKDVFNSLHLMRGKARYLKGELTLTPEQSEELLGTVRDMIDFARARTSEW